MLLLFIPSLTRFISISKASVVTNTHYTTGTHIATLKTKTKLIQTTLTTLNVNPYAFIVFFSLSMQFDKSIKMCNNEIVANGEETSARESEREKNTITIK